MNIGSCFITGDFKTAASQNSVSITLEMCRILVLFHSCSIYCNHDESTKLRSVLCHVPNNIAFIVKGKLVKINSIL